MGVVLPRWTRTLRQGAGILPASVAPSAAAGWVSAWEGNPVLPTAGLAGCLVRPKKMQILVYVHKAAPFCSWRVWGDKAQSRYVQQGVSLAWGRKKARKQAVLVLGPIIGSVFMLMDCRSTAVRSFSARKRLLPDFLTSWLYSDRQGIVSPTPSLVLPNLLRPKQRGYCNMAKGVEDRWRCST